MKKMTLHTLLMSFLLLNLYSTLEAVKPPCQACLSSAVNTSQIAFDVLITPDSKCVFAAVGNTVNSYEINNGNLQLRNSVSLPGDGAISLAFSPQNNCVIAYSVSPAGIGYITVIAFNQQTCMLEEILQQFSFTRSNTTFFLTSMSLSSDGRFLAVAINTPTITVNVYQFDPNSCRVNEQPLQQLLITTDPSSLNSVIFSKDSKYLAVSTSALLSFNNSNISIYDTTTTPFTLTQQVPVPNSQLTSIRFSSNDNCLSVIGSASQGINALITYAFDRTTGLLGAPVFTDISGAFRHAYSSDGTCLAILIQSSKMAIYNICRNSCHLLDLSQTVSLSAAPFAIEYSADNKNIVVSSLTTTNGVQLFQTNCS